MDGDTVKLNEALHSETKRLLMVNFLRVYRNFRVDWP